MKLIGKGNKQTTPIAGGYRKIPWRRKWQPTPVLLPGKSHGQRSLVGYSPWGCKELATTEWLHAHSLTVLYAVQAQRRTHTRFGVKKVTDQGTFLGTGDIKAIFWRMSRSYPTEEEEKGIWGQGSCQLGNTVGLGNIQSFWRPWAWGVEADLEWEEKAASGVELGDP